MRPRVQNLHHHYDVIVRSSELDLVVKAKLREDINVASNAEWTAMVDGAEASGSLGLAARMTLNSVGVAPNLHNKLHTKQVWMGTSPISFTLNLQFVAIDDPRAEVMLPTLDLMSMVFPTNETGGIYSTPDFRVSLQIGNLFTSTEMIVKQVNPTFWKQMTPEGLPLGSDVAVEFQTVYTPIVSELRKYFGA